MVRDDFFEFFKLLFQFSTILLGDKQRLSLGELIYHGIYRFLPMVYTILSSLLVDFLLDMSVYRENAYWSTKGVFGA